MRVFLAKSTLKDIRISLRVLLRVLFAKNRSCLISLYGVATISRLFYRALLQKRPILLRSQLVVATPYGRMS